MMSLFLVFLVAACASAGASGEGQARQRQDVITRVEIDQSGVTNLYDAVQRLRPRWLSARGGQSLTTLNTEIVVYQGQTLLGGVEVLRQLAPESVASLRFLDSATATASLPGLGSRHVAGAIVIETAGSRP